MAWKLSPLSWPDVRSGSALSWLGDTPPLNRSTSAAPLSWSMSANLLAFWKSLCARGSRSTAAGGEEGFSVAQADAWSRTWPAAAQRTSPSGRHHDAPCSPMQPHVAS
eukprot:352775-Chlamydomonas_euryale.AAC.5